MPGRITGREAHRVAKMLKLKVGKKGAPKKKPKQEWEPSRMDEVMADHLRKKFNIE